MSINSNLIAFSGTKCSGKDTASKMLQYCLSVPKAFRQYWIYKRFNKLFHKSWNIIAFADTMKKMLAELLNVPADLFNNRDFKEKTFVNLNTLQLIYNRPAYINTLQDSKFNKLAKELDLNLLNYNLSIRQLMQYFATNVCRKYFGQNIWINSTLHRSKRKTIISDCRFFNEAQAIKNNNGKIIFISRKDIPFGQHQSEKEMEQMLNDGVFDYVIENNGSLKDLFNQIKSFTNDK